MKERFTGWILTGVILLLLFVVGAMVKEPARLALTGQRARGTVVEFKTDSAGLTRPFVEFRAPNGERIRVGSRLSSAVPLGRVGDAVTVAYDPAHPEGAELLMLREFTAAASLLGFVGFIVLIWACAIVVAGPGITDPFHIMPRVVARMGLHPVRFPVIAVLLFALPVSWFGAYITIRSAIVLGVTGVTTTGQVTALEEVVTETTDGTLRGVHPVVAYTDRSGKRHSIRGTVTVALSRLEVGDTVEVTYPAERPDRGVLYKRLDSWLPAAVFGFFSVAFTFLFARMVFGKHDAPIAFGGLKRGTSARAIATVVDVDVAKRFIVYRIDKDPRVREPALKNFMVAQRTDHDWHAPKGAGQIVKGDQFRAYLDPAKPGGNHEVAFDERLGNNPAVKSVEEEEAEEDESDDESEDEREGERKDKN